MKVVVLSSGSKGNTTYIETKSTKLLIDAGNTTKYIENKLHSIGVKPEEIEVILITHTHVDHINGLKMFAKKYNSKVYIKEKMLRDLDYIRNYEIISEDDFYLKDIHLHLINTSHDVECSVGYILTNEDKSLVYITDTGYINKKYFDILTDKNIYIMESNHDVELLQNCSYPFRIRQRILSDKGHLSNYDASKYLAKFITDNTKYVLLAHLSQENNTEELAYTTLKERLNREKKEVNIIITSQDKETDVIEI